MKQKLNSSTNVEHSTETAILPMQCCTLPICLVSGGKDSQATAIWCLQNNVKPMFLFCDTEWEDIVTYEFVREFENKLGAEIVRLTSLGFVTDIVTGKQKRKIGRAHV